MDTLKSIVLFVVFIFFIHDASAAANNSGYWVGIFPNQKLTDTQSLSLQAESRHIGDESFGLFRPSWHYKILDTVNLGIGYDVFTTRKTEQRPWLEANINWRSWGLAQDFHFRFRQESRLKNSVSTTGWRSRLMMANMFVLAKESKLSMVFFDEIFYNEVALNNAKNYFDRNWFGSRLVWGPSKLHYDLGAFLESVNDPQHSQGVVATFSLAGQFF